MQRTCNRTGNLGNVHGVRHSGDIVVAFGRKEHLRFVFQTLEGVAVNNPIAVTLEHRAKIAKLFLALASARKLRVRSLGCQNRIFDAPNSLSYSHRIHHFLLKGQGIKNTLLYYYSTKNRQILFLFEKKLKKYLYFFIF